MTSPFDSRIYGGLFGDVEIAPWFDDREQIRAMLRVEAALAAAEARCGLVPEDAALRIADAARSLDPDPAALGDATASAGVPVAALVGLLRDEAGGDAGQYVHWGATSQDIVDTALALRLRPVLEVLDQRLEALVDDLARLAARHRDTPMLARTRTQAAVPTSFGLKAADWAEPLLRHRARLAELRPRMLVVQLGGAAGTLSVLGDAGRDVIEGLARELKLEAPTMPWHAQRDGIVELAGWFSLVTGSLARLGQDVMLLAQSGVDEVRVAGGGSSAMPQKQNPVAAEILVALGRHNASLAGGMHQCLVHARERDGAAWSSEWLALPQMAVAAGAALSHAAALVAGLDVDHRRMARNLEALDGLELAEAAAYALARHLPRPEAERLVRAAADDTRAGKGHLLDRLSSMTDAPVDWQSLRDPARRTAAAGRRVDEFIARHRRG